MIRSAFVIVLSLMGFVSVAAAQVTAPAPAGPAAIPEKNLTRDTDQPKAKGGSGSDPARQIDNTGSIKSNPADTSDALKPMNANPAKK